MTNPALPFRDCVRFYDREADLVSLLAEHVGPALRDGLDTFAVVRPEIAHALQMRLLRDWGSTPGVLTLIDAQSTLEQIVVEGWPEATAFDRHVAALVRMATTPGRSALLFGEMVTMLWDEGRREAAVRMEALWHDRLTRAQACVLCAYPARLFNAMDTGARDHVREAAGAQREAAVA
jgi:hypothetical protein